jgi:hypothetical protein
VLPDDPLLGSFGLVGGRLPGLILPFGIRVGRPAFARPQDVGRGVERDAGEPGPERVAAEARQVAIGGEEGFLDRIFGRGRVAYDTDDEGVEVVLVVRDELVERREVAVDGSLGEGSVPGALRLALGVEVQGGLARRIRASRATGRTGPSR